MDLSHQAAVEHIMNIVTTTIVIMATQNRRQDQAWDAMQAASGTGMKAMGIFVQVKL